MGTRLGPFEVVRTLGRGASGEVLEVRREGEARHLALKVLTRPDETARKRFEREAELLARLRHAAIVPIHAAGLLPDGRAYLLMGLVEGSTLRRRFQQGLLAPREAIQLGMELALALGHAHSQGVVHRDVKPENVLLDARGRPRLTDFGLALEEGGERLTLSGQVCGTVAYAAPEQVRAGAIGPPADVWSLGAVLHEALAGEPPFPASEVPTLVAQILQLEPRPLERVRPEVGPGLSAVVARCLAKDPAQRYPDGEALAVALARLDEQPLASVGRRIGAAAAAALLLVGAAGLGLSRDEGPAEQPEPPAPLASDAAPPVSAAATIVPEWFFRLPPAERPPLPLPPGLSFGEGAREYRNGWDGTVLVWVPPGTFTMGSDDLRRGNWNPAHRVTFTRGFWIGRDEVTWARYLRYAAAAGARRPVPDFPVEEDHPVHAVSWTDATEYCAWAGLRLPSEAEWEYAARGTDGRSWPWGEDPPEGRANLRGETDGWARTSPVGRFPQGASPFGCLDMAGNIAEWVQDGYLSGYPPGDRIDPAPVPLPAEERPLRVGRGGSWDSTTELLRTCSRERFEPGSRSELVGFRPVR